MLAKVKSILTDKMKLVGKLIYLSLIVLLLYSIPGPSEGQDYWQNATTNGTKIFTISFVNIHNGEAISAEGDVLITTDCSESWNLKNNLSVSENKENNSFLWKTDIYCSVMQTTDGGTTWAPYNQGKQEHFCGVYLKDQNTGYKVASEFLNKVSAVIFREFEEDRIDLLINHPQQCTEYFRNVDEGWALGWCVKNFDQNSIAEVK
jgi:hypothetical protein